MCYAIPTPSSTLWSVELEYDVNCMYHECTHCGHRHYDVDAPKQCAECGLSAEQACTPFLGIQHDDILSSWYWQEFVSDIRNELKNAFPSLYESESRIDRVRLDFYAILENRHVYIGLSEQYGYVAVWCVPKVDEGYYGLVADGLHVQWAKSIEKRAARVLKPLSRVSVTDLEMAA